MIPTSDLRKGNLVKTEYGILPVHHIVFDDVYVLGKDGRVLYARNVEGVELSEELLVSFEFEKHDDGGELKGNDCFYIHKDSGFTVGLTPKFCLIGYRNVSLKFAHELQNLFYWIKRKELIVKVNE